MKKFTAECSVETYVKFQKTFRLKIVQDIEITFPGLPKDRTIKTLLIKGKYKETNNLPLSSYLYGLMMITLQWISFCYIVPARLLSLNIEAEDELVVSGMISPFLAKFPVKYIEGDSKLKTFQKELEKNLLNSSITPFLSMFNDALNEESNYSRFWRLYNILQVLIGERKEIDEHLKTNYKVPLVKCSRGRKGQEVTIITAMRDSFSHPNAKFDGKTLNLEKSLLEQLPEIQRIVKDAIKEKLGLNMEI